MTLGPVNAVGAGPKAGPRAAPPNDGGLPAAAEVWRHGLLLLLLQLRGVGRVGPLAELDRQRLLGAVAGDVDLDLVADLVGVDERGQGGRVVDGLAADRGDDVARLQAAGGGGAAGRDLGHLGAGAGDVLRLNAEVGVRDLAGRAQLRDHALDRVGRDREADADVARLPVARAAGRLDLRVDADHLALRVEQRAAGVTGVDRGVGLQDVVDREAVRRGDLPLQRGDHAGGERAVEAERVADRVRGVADLDGARVTQRERLEVGGADLQQREIGRGVLAHELGRERLAVADLRLDLAVGALDHVGVGDDVAVIGDDEARTGADLGRDVGDRVLGVLVDVVRAFNRSRG